MSLALMFDGGELDPTATNAANAVSTEYLMDDDSIAIESFPDTFPVMENELRTVSPKRVKSPPAIDNQKKMTALSGREKSPPSRGVSVEGVSYGGAGGVYDTGKSVMSMEVVIVMWQFT
jgi:hypothetical protein